LKAVRMVKEKLGVSAVLGVSNVSHGMPARKFINSAFLSMAAEAGLDAVIINPKDETTMGMVRASNFLTGRDPSGRIYISSSRGEASAEPVKKAVERGLAERLKSSVIDGDEDALLKAIEDALAGGMSPMDINGTHLLPAMDEVGRRFASGEYFLPQVMLSAEAMKVGLDKIKSGLKDAGEVGPSAGRVVMATVFGDIHDIGKNIVTALLQNHGFDVMDLGKSVPAREIVEAAHKADADMIGLSALMTTTVGEMKAVIELARRGKPGIPVAVGGAVVTESYAREIGADLYAKDAMDGVKKIKEFVAAKRARTGS
jgi:5-methyltetrahydrofolate--homocysteine methyltransferase